ncbi:MAG: hypothetical protein RLZZ584_1431 [Pseudomonadota bacterium]
MRPAALRPDGRADAPVAIRPGAWTVRIASAHDLPSLRRWLPADAVATLPDAAPTAGDGEPAEHWLVACRRRTDAAGEAVAEAPAVTDASDPAAPGEPLACLRLRRHIGLDQPRHWYHRGCVVHAAPQLQLYQRQDTLLLGNDLTGAGELADLACDAARLAPAEQPAVLGLLVQAALLLVAARRKRYPPQLVAELAGQRDVHGQSPFWLGLGRHFYAGDPQAALQAWGPGWLVHLAPLLPRQPVYCAFLPEPARLAIGVAGAACAAAEAALRAAGLAPGRHVRVDDAGPVLEAPLDRLPALAAARPRQLRPAAAASAGGAPPMALRWWLQLQLQPRQPPVWQLLQAQDEECPDAAPGAAKVPAGTSPLAASWSLPLSDR